MEEPLMSDPHRLVAWVEPKDGSWAVAFISEATRWLRAPAVRLFSSVCEARDWVEHEAAVLGGIPIAWVDQADGASRQRQAA